MTRCPIAASFGRIDLPHAAHESIAIEPAIGDVEHAAAIAADQASE
jgi:hypothetical protein